MADLVVVSNRGPRSFAFDEEGNPADVGSGGGLASTLRSILRGTEATWVVAAMGEADRKAAADGLMDEPGIKVVAVTPDAEQYRMAYDVVSNSTLWFCHHHLFDVPRRPRFDRRWHEAWRAYRDCNTTFAEVIATHADEGGSVVVHDYHLALVGGMLRAKRPDLKTVHFTHTPFADAEMLRILPGAVVDELLCGMAGFDACGFHTARWERAFRGAFLEMENGATVPPRTFVSPLGVEPDELVSEAGAAASEAARAKLRNQVGGRKMIVRVDRIELSKNILRGFWAFEELLETRPDWHDKVVMVALVYPSRKGVAEYLAYRSEIEHTVARINERFGTSSWAPILLDVADDRARSMAALTLYDVLLVNPVRDGLNLVAKEGPVVNDVDGVLVLSSEAGAAEELHPAALVVNPFDVSATATTLDAALSMDGPARKDRAALLRRLVVERTAAQWWIDVKSEAGPAT